MNRRLFARPRGRIGALLGCVAVMVGAALLPNAASAATYPVRTCNDSGGPNHSFGTGCPNAGYRGDTNVGLFVRSSANGVTSAYGTAGGWSLHAPAGNTLDSMQFSDWIARATTNSFYSMLIDDATAQ